MKKQINVLIARYQSYRTLCSVISTASIILCVHTLIIMGFRLLRLKRLVLSSLFFSVYFIDIGPIVRIPFRRKRLDHIMLIQKLPKTFRCKLTAPIRMKHHAGRYTPCPNGILQRCNRKVCVDSSRQAKCYDFAGEQIHDRTKIIESTSGSDICKIAYPSHIRFFRFELLLQQIFAGFAFSIGMRFLFRRLKCAHFRKIHRFHQTVHSAAADVNAIFSCKAFGYFLRTQSLVAFDVKCKNFCTKLSVFNGSARIFAVAELVVGAPIDL